jgi:hypothetical protein
MLVVAPGSVDACRGCLRQLTASCAADMPCRGVLVARLSLLQSLLQWLLGGQVVAAAVVVAAIAGMTSVVLIHASLCPGCADAVAAAAVVVAVAAGVIASISVL